MYAIRSYYAIENTGTFQQAQYVNDMATIEDNLQRGKINAAVVIPPDYGDQLNSPTGTPTVMVILNGAESTPAIASLRAVQGVAQDLGQRVTIQRLNLNSRITSYNVCYTKLLRDPRTGATCCPSARSSVIL